MRCSLARSGPSRRADFLCYPRAIVRKTRYYSKILTAHTTLAGSGRPKTITRVSRKSAFHPTCSTLGIAGGGIGKAGPDRSRHQCACFRDLRMTADGGRISARRILLTRAMLTPTGRTNGPYARIGVTTSRSHAKGPCRNGAKMSSALAKSSDAIWYSAAAAFSATCSGRVAPIIAEDTSCLRNTQASATRSPSRGTAQPHQPITQNDSVTRKPTPLPGKRQTFAARLRPIARPASARALLSP